MPEVKTNKPPRYYSFGLVLYPDCDAHCRLIEYFVRRFNIFKPVWILHDCDTYDDADREKYIREHDGQEPAWNVGECKKPHWHVLITRPSAITVNGCADFLGLSHVEGINDKYGYLQYMLHDTPSSWNKHQYQVDDLMGDKRQIKKLLGQNADFV